MRKKKKAVREREREREREITEAVIDEIVKGVAIAVVSKLVVGSRKFLETLRSYAGEVACEFGVVG